jgi:hypothetical protein
VKRANKHPRTRFTITENIKAKNQYPVITENNAKLKAEEIINPSTAILITPERSEKFAELAAR